MTILDDTRQIAIKYLNGTEHTIDKLLGQGTQGVVFLSTKPTAIKVHFRQSPYEREVLAYRRLSQRKVNYFHGLNVPIMLGCHDELRIVELSVVRSPFLLDFGGAYLDNPPAYASDPADQARWETEISEILGKHYQSMKKIRARLQSEHGLYLTDIHPGNLNFEET